MFNERVWTAAGLHYRLWVTPDAIGWWLFGVAAIGVLFMWWARIHLGVLWSGSVTRKDDHKIVDTGPYRIVRHPIYTGLLIGALAVALLLGTVNGFAGFALLWIGFFIKARLEERFLRQGLGAEPYDAYAARVPMLVPFWR